MTNPVADVQIRSSLIDDYLQIAQAPVAPNLAGRFLVVQDTSGANPSTQLVTVPPDGGLVHFMPDTTSASGWSTTPVDVPTPPGAASNQANRLAGFYAGSVLNTLAYFPASNTAGSVATWMQRTADGTWSQATLTNDALNALGFTYQTDLFVDASGNGYLYGVTGGLGQGGAFFLVAYDSTNNYWDVYYDQYLSTFTPAISEGAAFRLIPGTGQAQFNILWVDGSTIYSQGAYLDQDGNFNWVGTSPQTYDPGAGQLSVSQISELPGPSGTDNVLLQDTNNVLWLVTGISNPSSATTTALTGATGQPAGTTAASVGLDANGALMVFAVEQNSQALWLQRQNNASQAAPPAFDSWVLLGDTIDTIACPAQMLAGAEVFTADLQATVNHLAQAPSDLVWSTRKVAAPSASGADPQNISSWTMEVTALDATGNPIPSAVLQITADQPTTIVSSNLSYQIGPSTPATLPTTPSGSLTLTIESVSLAASVVTVTGIGADGAVSRWCQGDVVQAKTTDSAVIPASQTSAASRLAGNDPNFPVSQSALQTNGLISPTYSGSDPISAINSVGTWMQANPQQPGAPAIDVSKISVPHFRIEFTPSGATYRTLTEAEAHGYLTPASTAVGRVEGIGGVFGDVAHFFKHAWQKLESFTATIVKGVLNVIFNDLAPFVVNTIREAAAAIETVFSTIMQGLDDVYDEIKKVVAWIKMLFDWNDILVTHEVIKFCVNSAFTQIPLLAKDFQNFVDGQFTSARTKITNDFNNLEAYFAPGVTFNAAVNSLGSNPGSGSGSPNSLDGNATTTAHAQNAANANYVSSKSTAYYSSPSATATQGGLQAGLQSTDLVSAIISQVATNWPQSSIQSNSQSVQSFVNSNISNPRQFFDLVIIDFLNAAKDLIIFVLDAAQAVFDSILDIAADAVSMLQSLLTASVDIPIISWLYKEITKSSANPDGDALTLLDLICLSIAVPATILYKVMFGNFKAPPFQASDLATLQQTGLPWPTSISAPATLAAGAVAATSNLPKALILTMGIVASISTFAGGPIGTMADALSFSPAPVPVLTQFISWASVIQGFISQVAGAPWSTFGKPNDQWNSADGWATTLWGASWVPFIYDAAFTISTEKLARFADLGPALDTGAGWVMTALGVSTLVEQTASGSGYSKWDEANDVLPQPARGFKFLVFNKDSEDPLQIAAAIGVLAAVDAVFAIGSMVTQIGSVVADDG
jgi:hypothetical protein